MTYLELYKKATKLVDSGAITIGEYEKMIEPLNAEIAEWVSVSERLPNDEAAVLVYDHNDIYGFGVIGSDRIVKYGDGSKHWVDHSSVTHWMPLPKSPKTPARYCLREVGRSGLNEVRLIVEDGTLEQCKQERDKALDRPHGVLGIFVNMAGEKK